MPLKPEVINAIIARVLDNYEVQAIEVMTGERMSIVGAAMRMALVEAGATNDELGWFLGNVISKIDGTKNLKDEQKNRSIQSICEAFRFDVQRIPTGPNKATYALKPRSIN